MADSSNYTPSQGALLHVLSRENWFIFPRAFLKRLTRDEALVLADLCNRSSQFRSQKNDGWFFYTVETLQESLLMDRNVQFRVIKNLKKKGYINTRKSGGPPAKRHIKINAKKIISLINEAEEELPVNLVSSSLDNSKPSSQVNSKSSRPYIEERNRRTNCRFSEDDEEHGFLPPDKPTKEYSRFHKEMAESIYHELKKKGKLTRKPNLRKWCIELRGLEKDLMDSRSITKMTAQALIQNIISDHIQNLSEQHQPQAWSARSIREEFPRLESAMKRRKRGGYTKDDSGRKKSKNWDDDNTLREDQVW